MNLVALLVDKRMKAHDATLHPTDYVHALIKPLYLWSNKKHSAPQNPSQSWQTCFCYIEIHSIISSCAHIVATCSLEARTYNRFCVWAGRGCEWLGRIVDGSLAENNSTASHQVRPSVVRSFPSTHSLKPPISLLQIAFPASHCAGARGSTDYLLNPANPSSHQPRMILTIIVFAGASIRKRQGSEEMRWNEASCRISGEDARGRALCCVCCMHE